MIKLLREFVWQLARLIADLRVCTSVRFLRDLLSRSAGRARLLSLAERSQFSLGDNVEVVALERLRIGAGTVIQSNVTLHCGGKDWTEGHGYVRLGTNVFVGHGSVLYGGGGISVGDDVLISPGVLIASHQHTMTGDRRPMRLQPTRFEEVTIESNVWIGSGAVILPGVTVSEGAVIGAGAVVSRDVQAFECVVGVPARPIRPVTAP